MTNLTGLPVETAREMYRRMVLIRRFEDHLYKLFLQGGVPGTLHQYQGQEAVAVGVCTALRPEDVIFSTHRPVGHFLARGSPARGIAAEIMGKATGCAGGKGGQMHLTDAAMGAFHEGLNLAAVKAAPVVFVCENNQYGASTAISSMLRIADIADRAASYGIPGRVADGMDVLAVHQAALEAVERARQGNGPTLLEFKTYRYAGHSRGDPGGYRSREEVERWRERDPIPRMRMLLIKEHGLVEADVESIEGACQAEVEEALEFALNSPEPAKEDMYLHIYAEDR
jgi:TPP-dependent pyruvate/acetoin dehydrogenase alpha subunit